MTAPTTNFIAMRDYGVHGWETLPMAATAAEIHDVLTTSFDGDDAMPADLTTCQVWHFTPDCPPRDVTEDVLTAIGRVLSERFAAEDYPDAFLIWADSDIQDAARDQAEADNRLEQRIADRMDAA